MACQGEYNTHYTTCSELIGDLNAGVYEKTLDRIFHHSVIVRIKGPSYRKRQGELLQEEYAENKNGNVEKNE